MSTIQVINAKHPSSASNNLVLDNAGNATFAGTAAMSSSFLRNRIINGDMRIDQRNAGASVSVSTGSLNFTVDRFYAQSQGGGVFTIQQSSVAPPGFTNSIIATVTTPDASVTGIDFYPIKQRIEGFNCADFGWGTASAQTVTLSFWVRSSVTGTYTGSLMNSASNRSYPFSYTINAANTFEYKTITIAGDTTGTWVTNNGIGIELGFVLGVGASYQGTAGAWAASRLEGATGQTQWISTNGATFYLTGVQLEVGSAATPFERRQFGTELMLCQRYYEKSYNLSAVPGTAGGAGGYQGQIGFSKPVSTFLAEVTVRFAVNKRAAPTITVFNPDSGASGSYRDFSAGVNRTGINLFDTGETGFKFSITDTVQEGGGLQFTAAAEL